MLVEIAGNTLVKEVTLYFKGATPKGGVSDKMYQLTLERTPDNKYVVNYSNGPRLGTQVFGTKTETPVYEGTARKEFDNMLREKLRKGYRCGPTYNGGLTLAL